jgi:benzoyl-CoA reductase/2-hydroxyglutaryl-CoA dehydratase subunit BcrC/BadD/HgdB
MSRPYRKLENAKTLNRLMTAYYLQARYEGRVRPMAWLTSGAPVEILEALRIATVYPENYGALCGAQRAATALCQVAEAEGFSQDLCSYARTSIGALDAPVQAPLGGLPAPDLLICTNNICGTVVKWYQLLAERFGVPLFMLDVPYVHDETPPDHAIAYVTEQLQEMIGWLTEHTGRRLDLGQFNRVLQRSNHAVSLWREIRELCKAKPSPLNAPDLFVTMAPIVVLRGTRRAVWFYERLKREVAARIRRGEGAVVNERVRLLWDNIAIWPRLFGLFGEFLKYGACFVVDTYTNAWSVSVEMDEPIRGLARTYTTVWINQQLPNRAHAMAHMVRDFGADGVVFHSNRSCKPYSLGQYDLRRMLEQETGVPSLVLEADMCDTRAFAESQLNTRIQAFMESLT